MAIRVGKVTMTIDQARMAAIVGEASNVGVGRMSRLYVNRIKQSFVKTSWFTPAPPGGPPGTVTGNLRRSITATPPANGRAMVGTNAKYARIQEYGGVITAKRSKFLTVPANVEAAKIRATVNTLRSVPGLSFRPGRRPGIAFLVRSGKGKGSGELMYVLKRSVKLPPRPFMRPAAANKQWRQDGLAQFRAGFIFVVRKHFRAAAAAGAPTA